MSRQNRQERFWTTPLALARRAEGRRPESTTRMCESGRGATGTGLIRASRTPSQRPISNLQGFPHVISRMFPRKHQRSAITISSRLNRWKKDGAKGSVRQLQSFDLVDVLRANDYSVSILGSARISNNSDAFVAPSAAMSRLTGSKTLARCQEPT